MSEGSNPGAHLPPPTSAGAAGFGPPDLGGVAGHATGHAGEAMGEATQAAGQATGHATGQATHGIGEAAGAVRDQQLGEAPSHAQHLHVGETGGDGSSMGQAAGDTAQRAGDAGQSAGAARTHDVAQRATRIRRWRHLRPRAQIGIIGGAAASAAIVVAGVAVATRDEPPAERPSAIETTIETAIEIAPTAAPVVTVAASVAPVTTAAPTTAAPTTVAEVTTTVEPTTTVAALPSGEGTYAVTGGEIVVVGSLLNGTIGIGDPSTWVLTGPCDGIGECTITVEGTSVASTAVATPLPNGGTISLAPAGPGTYLVTSSIEVPECGAGNGTMTITLADGVISGEWVVTFSGGAACPFTSLSTIYSGTRI